MRRWRWLVAIVAGVVVLVASCFLFFLSAQTTPAKSVAWSVHPDQFPLGTVLQGSRIEISFGVFSGLAPSPLPAFISRLPSPLSRTSEWCVERVRQLLVKTTWRLRVEAPDFVRVEHAVMQLHSSRGAFALISLRLKTDLSGQWNGNVVVHLAGAGYAATNIIVPVIATIIGKSALPSRTVLITETPYECYATGNGRDFEPLANLTTRLSQQAVRVDFCRQLPSSLTGYGVILLGGGELAELSPKKAEQLSKFVTGGGRLILAADAFFVPTAPKANDLLTHYGLKIINRDAGEGITNSTIAADALTSGVRRLNFWRPAQIELTDASQAKFLVGAQDEAGYVAISRQAHRGEVIVLTQSLWWNWIRSDPATADNSLLLENLLGR